MARRDDRSKGAGAPHRSWIAHAEHADTWRLRHAIFRDGWFDPIAQPLSEAWPTPSRRVLRGGAWNNNPRNLRAAYRNKKNPDNRNNKCGFRAASTPSCRSRRVHGRGG